MSSLLHCSFGVRWLESQSAAPSPPFSMLHPLYSLTMFFWVSWFTFENDLTLPAHWSDLAVHFGVEKFQRYHLITTWERWILTWLVAGIPTFPVLLVVSSTLETNWNPRGKKTPTFILKILKCMYASELWGITASWPWFWAAWQEAV